MKKQIRNALLVVAALLLVVLVLLFTKYSGSSCGQKNVWAE